MLFRSDTPLYAQPSSPLGLLNRIYHCFRPIPTTGWACNPIHDNRRHHDGNIARRQVPNRLSIAQLLMGLEPMTSSLPRTRSTTELQKRLSHRLHRATEASRRPIDPAGGYDPDWNTTPIAHRTCPVFIGQTAGVQSGPRSAKHVRPDGYARTAVRTADPERGQYRHIGNLVNHVNRRCEESRGAESRIAKPASPRGPIAPDNPTRGSAVSHHDLRRNPSPPTSVLVAGAIVSSAFDWYTALATGPRVHQRRRLRR